MEELETPPLPEVPEESAGALQAAGIAPAEAAARVEETMPAGHAGGDAEGAPRAEASGEQHAPSEGAGADAEAVRPAEAPEESAATLEAPGIAPAEAAVRVEETMPAGHAGGDVGGGDAGEPAPAPPRSAATLEPAGPIPVEDASPMREPAPAEAGQVSMEELLAETEPPAPHVEDAQLRAVLEAIIYVAEEPLTLAQLAAALHEPAERMRTLLEQLAAEYDKPEHGITVREVAGGYKMATKPEHHEGVRSFVKSLKPPLKLSLPALETLAVIAYKQPVTAPEIMEIRGVQGTGVLKTLLDRKLIGVAGRKNVIGKPILYRTTKDFLIQFGLKDLSELPSLKEFEDIRRMALSEGDVPAPEPDPEPAAEPADATGKPELFHVKQLSQAAAETPETAPVPAAELSSGPAPNAPAQPAAQAADSAGKPELFHVKQLSQAAVETPETAPAPAAELSSAPAPNAPAQPAAQAGAAEPPPEPATEAAAAVASEQAALRAAQAGAAEAPPALEAERPVEPAEPPADQEP